MKNWLLILIVFLAACTKDDDKSNEPPPLPPSVECDIIIKACTPVPGDTVYLKWIDSAEGVKDAYIKTCLYIHANFYTGDTMHFEYNAIKNNLEMYISVNDVLVFDTVFPYTTVGFYDFIVVEPE